VPTGLLKGFGPSARKGHCKRVRGDACGLGAPLSKGSLGRGLRRRLACLVGRKGTKAEAVHDLIDISPEIETQLRRDAELSRSAGSPAAARRLLAMIAWRKQVLAEFDRVLQEEVAASLSRMHR